MEEYGLSEEDWNQKVSDIHVGDISQSYCDNWRDLYPHLHLKKIVASDADRNHGSEVKRKAAFFNEWKEQRASEATYRRLVYALLRIGSRQDAASMCELLAKSLGEAKPQSQSAISSSTTTPVTTAVTGNLVHALFAYIALSKCTCVIENTLEIVPNKNKQMSIGRFKSVL